MFTIVILSLPHHCYVEYMCVYKQRGYILCFFQVSIKREAYFCSNIGNNKHHSEMLNFEINVITE